MTQDNSQYVDYLDVDKPLPGQNYACLSFLCPEEIIQKLHSKIKNLHKA